MANDLRFGSVIRDSARQGSSWQHCPEGMLKRRLRDAGHSTIYSNHSFRAAGITNYLENDGTLEVAQRIAGHADSRTTKLYDRRGQKVLVEDMERIRY